MVKRALIECTEKGLSLNNEGIVHFCQRPSRYTVRLAHIAQARALQHVCVSPPHRSAAPRPAVHLGCLSPACSAGGLGLRGERAGAARERVLPALAVIRETVCLCELHAAEPALQQTQADSRNWVKCDHYSRPPPHQSSTVHRRPLCNSALSF